jgi:hypothetical protein
MTFELIASSRMYEYESFVIVKPLTLSLTGSWPPSISLLEACSGPLKRATLAEKRLF